MEVEHNVHQENHIHNAVYHQPGDVVLLGLEGHVVGDHNGCVEGEDENHPVPGSFEGAVVQDDMRRCFWSLLFVLREDVRA